MEITVNIKVNTTQRSERFAFLCSMYKIAAYTINGIAKISTKGKKDKLEFIDGLKAKNPKIEIEIPSAKKPSNP